MPVLRARLFLRLARVICGILVPGRFGRLKMMAWQRRLRPSLLSRPGLGPASAVEAATEKDALWYKLPSKATVFLLR